MFLKHKNVKHILCVIYAFTKYAWFKPLKYKGESDRKPNKLWVDQGREFYNKLMQEWFDKNDILMYSTQNEGKSVIAERFIKLLNAKIYQRNDS